MAVRRAWRSEGRQAANGLPAGCAQRVRGRELKGGPRGFTLVEVLVALAVFAVVGLLSAQLLSRTLVNHEILSERSARLAEVQRAMLILKRDLAQITERPVRDLFGDSRESVMIGADGMMEFSRVGWRNPLNSPRSEMQRVAYRMHEGHLHRAWWSVLDRAQDSEPIVQRLLSDVEQVEFFALDANGDEHSFWPARLAREEQAGTPLVAIVMRLECEPFGIVERLWPVGGTMGAWMPTTTGSDGGDDGSGEGAEEGEGEQQQEEQPTEEEGT